MLLSIFLKKRFYNTLQKKTDILVHFIEKSEKKYLYSLKNRNFSTLYEKI